MVLCHNVCNVLFIFIHKVSYYSHVIECVMMLSLILMLLRHKLYNGS